MASESQKRQGSIPFGSASPHETLASAGAPSQVVVTRRQQVAGILLLGLLAGALVISAETTAKTAMLLITVLYLVSAACRLWLSIIGARMPLRIEPVTLPDHELPTYTLLIPVYREARLIERLLDAIARLDYPVDKLDVLVLVEQDDHETRSALEMIAIPAYVRMLVVPDSGPKGKPRACNAGLAKSRGDYLVIYDAEDVPEPDQLRKVVAVFRASSNQLACVQCKLDFYNAEQNLLTRWFTTEYSAWFDLYLPGLQSARLPIPLGGTSNHFDTSVLRELGGWDAFNVTEDADLGMRLARADYTTQMIDSTTWEEANSRLGNWIRQRSRWMKGYALTWLVHMRNPVQLYREVGARGFLGIQLTLGITILMALLNPLFWLMMIVWLFTGNDVIHLLFEGPTFYLGSASLFFGNWILILTAMIGCYRRRHFRVVKYALLLPIYWCVMSIAAWKGVLQLWKRPSFWEKTVHGLTSHAAPSLALASPGWDLAPHDLTAYTALAAPLSVARAPYPRAGTERDSHSAQPAAEAREQADNASIGRTDFAIWLVFGALASLIGIWAGVHQQAFHGDALSRTYAAVQVVHGFEPKLANLGFVWPILPTIVQLPLVVVAPGFAAAGGVGPMMSGVAFGAAVMLLNLILRFYLPGRFVRWTVLVLAIANPLVFQLATSGMSEMAFVSFLMLSWWGVEIATRCSDRRLQGVVIASLGASGAFNCRYEGAVIGMALLAALVGLLCYQAWERGALRRFLPEAEGGLALFLACFGYAVVLFVFFNYTIMGDVLYFARGTGSNAQWMKGFFLYDQTIANLVHDPVASITYAMTATWLVFAGLLVALPVALVLMVRTRDFRLFFLVAIAMVTPAQQAFLVFQGQSPAWKRFYVACIFFGVLVLVAIAGSIVKRTSPRAGRIATVALIAVVALSSTVAWIGKDDSRIATDFNQSYLARAFSLSSDASGPDTGEEDGRRIGHDIASRVLAGDPNALILTDDLEANLIILFSGTPQNFIVPNVRGFDAYVENPVGNVDYILVPESRTDNLILDVYPDLLTNGASFLTLDTIYQEKGGARHRWYLFRVNVPQESHQCVWCRS